jgi:beta-phosphoglucomutase
MVKGVIFDMNGVIVDDYPLQKEAWNNISQGLRKRNVTDQEMITNIRGVPTKNVIAWMSNNSLSQVKIDDLIKKKMDLIFQLYKESPLFCLNKGLDSFFNELKANNIPYTIATSTTLDDVYFHFDRLGLYKWFDVNSIIYNDGSCKGKPAPDVYLKAASKLKLSPSECVVFEDAASGIRSAYTAGSKYIIAVGSDERLLKLKQLPGVILGIHNFTEINLDRIMQLS